MALRKKRFFGAVFIDMVGTPLTMFLGIIFTPIYFNYITTSEFGFWTTVLEMMTLLTLLNSGLGYYIIQTVTDEPKKGLRETRSVLSSVLSFQIVVLVVMSVTCAVLYRYLPIFKEFTKESDVISWVYVIMSVNLIVVSVSSYMNFILQGQNKVVHTNLFTLVKKLLTQIIPVVFLIYGVGIISFPLAYILTNCLLLTVLLYLTFNYLKVRISLVSVSKSNIKKISTFSIQTFFGGTSYYVLNFTDAIVISGFISNSGVTVYVLTMKLGNFLRFIPARVVAVGVPVISQLINDRDYKKLQELTLKFFRFSLRFGLLASISIYLLNSVFVENWVGIDKYGGFYLSLFSALICFREAIFPVFSGIIYMTKDVKRLNTIFFIEAILNLSLSVFLVNVWGINGVALATVISLCFFSMIYGVRKASTIIHIPLSYYIPSIARVILRSAPSLVFLFFSRQFFGSHFSWMVFFSVMLVTVAINLLCFEGVSIFSYRSLTPKQILLKLIDEA